MSQEQQEDLIPVPRQRIFVIDDGTFVVQWEEHRVQSLISGRYFQFSQERFGSAISDYELNQLKNSGIVYTYDEELVYLSPNPMVAVQGPPRSYYLNTGLPKTRRLDVEEALKAAGLQSLYSVRVQEIFVIIRGAAGMPFRDFDAAGRARETLQTQFPDLLPGLIVAFVEINTSR